MQHLLKVVMKYLLSALLLIGIFIAQSQPGWNWPEDPDLKSEAQSKEAFYKVSLKLENWDDALGSLNWLYKNNPELNKAIYVDGVKVLESIIETDILKERQSALEDSILWMYDQRIEYFDEDTDAEVMDRKAYTAFRMFYKRQAKYPLLADLYEEAFALNGSNISTFNLAPYMTLAKYYNQSNPEEMPAERVLDIHSTISDAISGMEGKVPADKLKNEQDKVDALLSSMDNILNCDFIASQLVPKLEKDPNDLNTAKKIFTYSLRAKCSDQPYFTKAGEVVFADKPDFRLASALASRYLAMDQNDKAISYYNKSVELAGDDEQKYEGYISLASAYSKLGNKVKSREMARNALQIKPNDSRAFNIIGNLYFGSFEDCKGGESKVLDRAVFIAAYTMYEKAGNTEQMAATKEQFPSIEEIFNENYKEGDIVKLGCWINENVALQRRD